MRRVIAALLLCACGAIAGALPTHAAGTRVSHQKKIDWNQRDTAVYVVSTLNLLYTKQGRPFLSLLRGRLNVTRYDVYADTDTAELYFITLKREDGSVIGAFAYRMGWSKPRILFLLARRPVAHRGKDKILTAYRADGKQLIGSFSSTLPS